MPTIVSHLAVPLALGLGLGQKRISPRCLFGGMVLAVLPDLDVLAFRFGIAYGNGFGHRGFSHSLLFAALAAGLFALILTRGGRQFIAGFAFLFVSAISHALLDAMTNGGLGVALFWPWSAQRFFLPWHPIEASPLRLSRLLSGRAWVVLYSELRWIWLPGLGVMLSLLAARRGGQCLMAVRSKREASACRG